MNRRGSCSDNAVEEAFFQLLKRSMSNEKIYSRRDETQADIFDDTEWPYNNWRR